jgi:hypothetical protein
MVTWYILWPFGMFYGHLVYFMIIWYIFARFTMKNLAALLNGSAQPVLLWFAIVLTNRS